jgi:membrane protein implicated in regulation of membrane protease activity
MNDVWKKLATRGVLPLVAGAIVLVYVVPAALPAVAFAVQGTVITRTYRPAHSELIGQPQSNSHAPHTMAVGEQYLIEIRLDSGEIVRSTWPVPTIDKIPVGQRVSVTGARRGFAPLWHRTLIREVSPIRAE